MMLVLAVCSFEGTWNIDRNGKQCESTVFLLLSSSERFRHSMRLNLIQSECMDFEEIYRKYEDKISHHGMIGTQTVTPHGTREVVKENVWRNLDSAGEKGRLMGTPIHMLELEVSIENILAYVETCREYKKQ